jgi:hypothetical protein
MPPQSQMQQAFQKIVRMKKMSQLLSRLGCMGYVGCLDMTYQRKYQITRRISLRSYSNYPIHPNYICQDENTFHFIADHSFYFSNRVASPEPICRLDGDI